MFIIKISILIVLWFFTFIPLISITLHLRNAFGNKDITQRTSWVDAKVVEVNIPSAEEVARDQSVPPNAGRVIAEYSDAQGQVQKQEFGRVNSAGPNEYFNMKVGDRFKLEIPDSVHGATSSAAKQFWGRLAVLLAQFAFCYLLGAAIFRFM